MKLSVVLPASAIFVAAAFAAPAVAQTRNGKLINFSMTTTLQMQGKAMPPHTASRQVCTAPGKLDPKALMQQSGDCKVDNYRQQGQTISFHVACTQPESMAADGVFHQRTDGGFDGSMHATINAAGHAMTVDTHYQGTPAGSCVYQPKS